MGFFYFEDNTGVTVREKWGNKSERKDSANTDPVAKLYADLRSRIASDTGCTVWFSSVFVKYNAS